jgi:Tol biopolymer transport system component
LAGDELIATRFDPQTRNPDIIIATLQGDNVVVRDVLATADMEFSPELSPDGRWLAYVSDRTGQLEVWVMRYPGGAPERVSRRGGIEPVWSRDGRELFYRQETGGMMAVAVDAQGEFQEPTHLFDGPYVLGTPGTVRSYDVSADGRFLMVGFNRPGADVAAVPATVVVVQNWPEELKQRVPRN